MNSTSSKGRRDHSFVLRGLGCRPFITVVGSLVHGVQLGQDGDKVQVLISSIILGALLKVLLNLTGAHLLLQLASFIGLLQWFKDVIVDLGPPTHVVG